MLASDFDRTFYVNCEITEANIRAVENWRLQGNLFVIATGRKKHSSGKNWKNGKPRLTI